MEEPSKLARNERLKLRASYLNALAIGLAATGVVPLYVKNPTIFVLWPLQDVLACLVLLALSFGVHLMAQASLLMLED